MYFWTFTVLPLALVFLLYWLVGSLVWLTCGEGQLSYSTWPWNLQGYWSQLLPWAWPRLRRESWLAEGIVWRLEIEVLMMAGKDHPRWQRQYLLLSHIMCWICKDCFECCGMWWLLLKYLNITCSSSSLPVPAKLRELRCFWDSGYCK